MASTTFVAGTVIPVDWLNEVNSLLWGSASPPGTKIRVNTSGNVGIGITPTTGWRVGSSALQVGVFATLWTQSNGSTSLGFGLYEGGTNTFNYQTTGDIPTLYSQLSGNHIWYRASSSGTVGNSVTLLENGRWNETGKFLIGTTVVGISNNGNTMLTLRGGTGAYISASAPTGQELIAGADSSGSVIGSFSNHQLAFRTNNVDRFTLSSSGDFTSSGGLIGYGTGAGGAVTQLTSKATDVTLNTSSGRITMHNAALSAGASVSFVMFNTKIGVSDTILVNIYESFSGANYSVRASVGNNYARITLTNQTGGSLSDAVQINFSIIKASLT